MRIHTVSFETTIDFTKDRFEHIAKDFVNRIKFNKSLQLGCLRSIFMLIPCYCYFFFQVLSRPMSLAGTCRVMRLQKRPLESSPLFPCRFNVILMFILKKLMLFCNWFLLMWLRGSRYVLKTILDFKCLHVTLILLCLPFYKMEML